MSNVVFKLSGVGKLYGGSEAGRALGGGAGGIDLCVRAGERLALVGPSGSGKTTLLGLLNGRLGADEGKVEVFGELVKEGGMKRRRARMAWIPQELGLVPNLRVIQNVVMGRAGSRSKLGLMRDVLFPKGEVIEEVYEILRRVGIEDKLYLRTDTLSGGQRQRVAIARALFQDAEVILADEPVSSVDPGRARDLVGLLTELSQEDGRTLVMSIHQMELAREFFPRLVGLRGGGVVFDGVVNEEMVRGLYDLEA